MMETQYAFLGLLTREPNYGYELKKLYDHYFAADKPILAGQVYATLARLARDLKVEEVDDDGASGGPARTRYTLTAYGKAELERWLETPEPPAPTLQANLFVKVVLILLTGGDGRKFIAAQKKSHIQRMRELTTRKLNAPLAEKLLIDNAIFHIEADIRWMDLTSARIDQLKEEL